MERAFAPHRRRTRSLLFLFLAVSAALHAAVLGVLPGFLSDREVPQAAVLEVVLVQTAPAQPPAVESVLVRREPLRSRPDRAAAIPPILPRPPSQAEAPLPVMTLLEPNPLSDANIAVPRADQTRAAPAESKTEVASVTLTPPSFSAAYLRNPPPRYPRAARQAGEQGTVTLRVLITREGLPARVDLDKSSGSAHLDNAALEAVKTWRFAPARRGAEPVESWWVVPIVFRLEGSS